MRFLGHRNRRESLIVWTLGLATLIIGLAVASLSQTVLDRLTALVFDSYQRLLPREEAGAPLVLVDIDESAIAAVGQWPWPRTVVAEIVDRLGELGAATIAFDIVFPEPDRTSLTRILADLAKAGAPAVLPTGMKAIDNDAALADAFARNSVTAGIAISNETDGALMPPKAGFAFGGQDPKAFLEPFRGGVANLPMLTQSASGFGFFSFPPSPDGIVREIPIVTVSQGKLYPSLAVEALRVAQDAGSFVIRTSGSSGEIDAGAPAMTALKVGDLEIPTSAKGTFWIYFSGLKSVRTISAAALLDPGQDRALADLVAGKIVLIGTSAVGLRDLVATPVAASMPGVRVHAEIIDQILGQTFLTRPDWAKGAETVAALLLGILLIAVSRRAGPLVSSVGTVGFVLASVALSWVAFSEGRLLIDPILPAVSVASVFAVTMPTLLLLTASEKRFIRKAFAQYLSPTLVKRLADDPGGLQLGGEMRDLTVLFTDIRGFTTLSEKLDPQALTTLLNGFLTPMTDILLQADATIDKYMGDAIMAFWNAPIDIADHRRRGCLAALAMIEGLQRLDLGGGISLRIGIGLNAGPCCVGNLGSSQRFSYSAIGDGVNVASRVEGLTKGYGLSILVTDDVRRGAEDLAFLDVDSVRVVGRHEALVVHALVGDAAHAQSRDFRALAAAHAELIDAYRRADLATAGDALERARLLGGETLATLYRVYQERLDVLERDGVPPDWDGVFVPRHK